MAIDVARRADLTLDAAQRVGWDGEGVTIAPGAKAAMAAARAGFERLMDEPGIVIYGVTSGYGQEAHRKLTGPERMVHARRPQLAVQANTGELFPERAVRLMVFARLANFLEGHAAVRPKVAEAVAELLTTGPMPPVPRDGAMCAGEILPLGWLFADLTRRIDPHEKEALALINGSPVAAALISDGAIAAKRRLALAEPIFALAAEAYRAPLGHFSPEISRLAGDPYEIAAAESLSALWAGGTADRRPYQAPVSFRILPKMLARLRRDIARAVEVAGLSLSQVSDNPTFLPPDAAHPNGRILSTGGYHNAAAWPALNALAAAYADLCMICDRLISRMLDGKTSGLPDQLMTGSDERYYMGTLGFALAGYGEKARRAAQAVLLPGSEGGGFVQNDVAVPTTLAWEGAEEAGRMLDKSLGAVAVVASQALFVTQRHAPPALQDTLAMIHAADAPSSEPRSPGLAAEAAAQAIRARIYSGKIAGA